MSENNNNIEMIFRNVCRFSNPFHVGVAMYTRAVMSMRIPTTKVGGWIPKWLEKVSSSWEAFQIVGDQYMSIKSMQMSENESLCQSRPHLGFFAF